MSEGSDKQLLDRAEDAPDPAKSADHRAPVRLRCPYCRKVFEGAHAQCPFCARTMLVPARILSPDMQVRRRTKERRTEDSARARRQFIDVGSSFGRRPSHILGVIAVLAVVGGLLISGVDRRPPGDREVGVAGREVNTLRAALEVFRKDCGRYPTAEEGIFSLIHNCGARGWDGPYVSKMKPDPWQSQYVYLLSNGVPQVMSCGRDRVVGTADDILPVDAAVRILLK